MLATIMCACQCRHGVGSVGLWVGNPTEVRRTLSYEGVPLAGPHLSTAEHSRALLVTTAAGETLWADLSQAGTARIPEQAAPDGGLEGDTAVTIAFQPVMTCMHSAPVLAIDAISHQPLVATLAADQTFR